MKVRVISKCYYGERTIKPNMGEKSIIEFHGDKLPSWAEAIYPDGEKLAQTLEDLNAKNKPPEPTTLHEMAEKKTVKVSKPSKRKSKKTW